MNAGTIIVLLIVVGVVALVIRKIVRDKKSGKTCSSCGGGCGCDSCSPGVNETVHKGK